MNMILRSLVACLAAVPAAHAALPDWKTATQTDLTPAASYYFSDTNTGISGFAPQATFIGDFTGARSFEFIVNAGLAGSSSSLLAYRGSQGLKFEQGGDTGHIGMTDFGVADYDSPVATPANEEAQIVFTSDGTDTLLYVNGVLRHTFTGIPLRISGTAGLGGTSETADTTFADPLDGHILGFASYDSVLTPEAVAAHYTSLAKDRPAVSIPAWQAAVNASPVPPVKTIFNPISGRAPVTENVGDFTGSRTFEFLVYAGETGGSEALMGLGGAQALKFEQWSDTTHLGLTGYGVADYDSQISAPFYQLSQIVYVSDGTKTDLYVNGIYSYTFTDPAAALSATGLQGLGAAASITGGTSSFRDPLDGTVLRFASYDRALAEDEVSRHYKTFTTDAGAGLFSDWDVEAFGDSPVAMKTEPATGAGQVTVDTGNLTGDRSFEFIVHAGIGLDNGAILGDAYQALKYEQWFNTGMIGMTDYGIADYTSTAASPENVDAHIVYSSDGTDTKLYVNGSLQYTFVGAPLKITGTAGLACGAAVTPATSTYFDVMDGHILGFASYGDALSAEEIAAHYAALITPVVQPPAGPFYITDISRNATSGEISLTWTSSPGQKFGIVYSTNPATFPNTVSTGIDAGAGSTTTATFATPAAGAEKLFFRVVRQ